VDKELQGRLTETKNKIAKVCALTFTHGTPFDAVTLSGSAPR